ncbi:hypothetical protein [Georgenia yuyongxinii]
MPQRRASDATASWKRPEVVAAALAAAAAVVVAVINVAGDDGGAPADDSATVAPGPAIELLQTGTTPAQPPPAVSYWFEGRVQELRSNQRVFVFGYFDDAAPAGSNDDGSQGGGQPQPVSPAAEYFPGGSWRVDWTLPEPPGSARFEAVLVEVPGSGNAGKPGDPGAVPESPESPPPPSADDAVSRLIQGRLARTGPADVLIVARDHVVVEQDTGSP